jgi:hypothetical protein
MVIKDIYGNIKTVILLISLLFSNGLLADNEYWSNKPLSAEIKFSQYKVTKQEVIKSVVGVVLKNNWVITDHTSSGLLATYRDRIKLKISFANDSVLLNEIPSNLIFKKSWMNSLQKYINQKIQYYHYVRSITEYEAP